MIFDDGPLSHADMAVLIGDGHYRVVWRALWLEAVDNLPKIGALSEVCLPERKLYHTAVSSLSSPRLPFALNSRYRCGKWLKAPKR